MVPAVSGHVTVLLLFPGAHTSSPEFSSLAEKMPPRKNKLPVPMPEGWIVTDMSKKSWKLGKKLGQGGFGLIYLASPACDTPVRDDAAYVIKVEDHQNGPLFCELKFYQRAAKQDDVTKWIQSHKLDYLGIPRYWGSGETTFNSISYRFMVIDHLGSDLHNLQKSNSGRLPLQAVMQVGVRMLDVLEYIHEHEYVHGDIKSGNILCHLTDPSKVYLADYGLSYRYCPDGKHKEYKEDPRKCHNGTLEFTSLDAHKGAAPSRRGDLEILSFCMLHWLSGRLPWDQDLKFPSTVQAAKQKLMDEVPNSVTAWLGQEDGCNDVAKFMAAVRTLQYSVKPNYKGLKEILLKALESAGTRLSAPLIFSNQNSTSRRPTAPKIKSTVNVHAAQKYKLSVRNPCCQKGKTYREEREVPLEDANSQHRDWNGKAYWEEREASLEEQKSQHQDWKDIYKYGLIIPILLLMIYLAINGLK